MTRKWELDNITVENLLTMEDIEFIGKTTERHTKTERLILLVKLKTPYINFLGNIAYKIPFYKSSGTSGTSYLKGLYVPFFGYHSDTFEGKIIHDILIELEDENALNINQSERLTENEEYKRLKKEFKQYETLSESITSRLWTVPKLTKCMFPIFKINFFESQKLKKIVSQSIFQNNEDDEDFGIHGPKFKLCNEYLDKYSIAITKLFEVKEEDLKKKFINIDVIPDKEVNDRISTNSIYGININTIPPFKLDKDKEKIVMDNSFYQESVNKIENYKKKWIKLWEDYKKGRHDPKESTRSKRKDWLMRWESILSFVSDSYGNWDFNWGGQPGILTGDLPLDNGIPSNYDIISFFNIYYDNYHIDHHTVQKIVKIHAY